MSARDIYDVAVIGGGAAGSMAAIRAAEMGKRTVLIERNDSIGRKILITGKGRCNITNNANLDSFVKKFGKNGNFFRTAFFKFFNQDLIHFFETQGLELKVERQGRVFPVTDKAVSVTAVLISCLEKKGVKIIYATRVKDIEKGSGVFRIETESGMKIGSRTVVLATGGASYEITGSSGDGFTMAKSLGHSIAELKPGLVPLRVKESWVKELQGVALENVRLVFKQRDGKRVVSEIGELMFTHFGVSGPLILDMSGDIVIRLETSEEIGLLIDLKPGMSNEQLESRLLHKLKIKGNIYLRNLMKDLLPQRLIPVFLKVFGLKADLKTNQITQQNRRSIIDGLKAFPLTITGALPLEEAMVTAGGVLMKEINPRTMESRVIKGLYFAGEIIEGAAPSGGYNLQEAFSTGYLAGEEAANA